MGSRKIVHIEIPAADSKADADFYKELFGWEIEHYEEMDYTMFDSGSIAGGFSPLGDQVAPGDVLLYIESDDIEADLKAIEGKGGETVVPKTEIPNMGWFAWFKDPTGNVLGLYTGMQNG